MQPTVDMDLQLLGPFLRNEARSIVSAIKPGLSLTFSLF